MGRFDVVRLRVEMFRTAEASQIRTQNLQCMPEHVDHPRAFRKSLEKC